MFKMPLNRTRITSYNVCYTKLLRVNDKEEFERVYKNLSYFIENDLHPFMSSKMKEDEFYEQFDGVKVLPVSLECDYVNFINQGYIQKAEALKVQISEKRFLQLFYNEGVSKERTVFEIMDVITSYSIHYTKLYDFFHIAILFILYRYKSIE